jgi:MFS family permease
MMSSSKHPGRPGRIGTGALLIAGAVVANAAFAGLGAVFDYPDVLRRPAEEILTRFHADALIVGGLFLLLACGAALLAPIAVRLSRIAGRGRLATAAMVTGIAAAAVQVIGLLRWPLAVPFLAGVVTDPAASAADRADATDTFRTLHTVLGQAVGEAGGYALTAAWTVLVIAALPRPRRGGRIIAALGLASAAMILAGLLSPLGVPGADLANFLGYLAWSVWLVALGIAIIRDARFGSRPRGTVAEHVADGDGTGVVADREDVTGPGAGAVDREVVGGRGAGIAADRGPAGPIAVPAR